MKTYRQIRRRKEWHCIKAIGERLDDRDFKKLNPNYKGMIKNEDGNWETGWVNVSYCHDKWYLFDLLEWARMKRWTL